MENLKGLDGWLNIIAIKLLSSITPGNLRLTCLGIVTVGWLGSVYGRPK